MLTGRCVSRRLLLTWAQEVCVLMKRCESYSPLFALPSFNQLCRGLLANGLSEDPAVCLQSCRSLQALCSALSTELLQR